MNKIYLILLLLVVKVNFVFSHEITLQQFEKQCAEQAEEQISLVKQRAEQAEKQLTETLQINLLLSVIV
ncbi:MAG: hypothetical protein GY749_15160 [Desulfobacteraceae bacterium]|nr:hypothetical protein [Desulfobacteraceae bacterium]